MNHEGLYLGLVGGLGPGATVHYYQQLVKEHDQRGLVARMLIAQADMPRMRAAAERGDRIAMADHLADLIRRMAAGGAQIAAVSAITPHMCIRELTERSPIPLVDQLEEVAKGIRARGLKRVALFGTRYTVESRMFGQLAGIEVVMPKPDEIAAIHETYFQIVDASAGNEEQFQRLRRIAHTLCDRDGAEAIVLAGTDLSLLFREDNTDFPYVDAVKVHVDAIMQRMWGFAANDSQASAV